MSRNGATLKIAVLVLTLGLRAWPAGAVELTASAGSLPEPKRPALDLSIRGDMRVARPGGVDGGGRPTGIARTSVERRLTSDGLIGSAGFLCGMQPGATSHGAMAARGVDPNGRFLGAKLRFGF